MDGTSQRSEDRDGLTRTTDLSLSRSRRSTNESGVSSLSPGAAGAWFLAWRSSVHRDEKPLPQPGHVHTWLEPLPLLVIPEVIGPEVDTPAVEGPAPAVEMVDAVGGGAA